MWKLYKYEKPDSKVYLDEIDLPCDCFGDDLYDFMTEMGYIEDIEDYDVDGDTEYVAVMGHWKGLGQFCWEFTTN